MSRVAVVLCLVALTQVCAGAKRTLRLTGVMSAFDPKRTLAFLNAMPDRRRWSRCLSRPAGNPISQKKSEGFYTLTQCFGM
jgi:hypothetical protein